MPNLVKHEFKYLLSQLNSVCMYIANSMYVVIIVPGKYIWLEIFEG